MGVHEGWATVKQTRSPTGVVNSATGGAKPPWAFTNPGRGFSPKMDFKKKSEERSGRRFKIAERNYGTFRYQLEFSGIKPLLLFFWQIGIPHFFENCLNSLFVPGLGIFFWAKKKFSRSAVPLKLSLC